MEDFKRLFPIVFLGRDESKVYSGGRIHIPSMWRVGLRNDSVVATRDVSEPNAVCLMPEGLFERELNVLRAAHLPPEQREALMAAKHLHIAMRGCVRLPKELLSLVGAPDASGLLGVLGKIVFVHSGRFFLGRISPLIRDNLEDRT